MPASASSLATTPPPAPDPMTTTSTFLSFGILLALESNHFPAGSLTIYSVLRITVVAFHHVAPQEPKKLLIGRSCCITGLEVLKDCGLSVGALGNKAASELLLTRCVYPKEAFFIAIPVEFSEGASENSVDVKDDSRCLAAGKLIRRNHQFRNGLNQSGLRNGEEFATRSQRVGNRSAQHGQGSHGHCSGCRHGLQEISSMHRVGHSRPPKGGTRFSRRRTKPAPQFARTHACIPQGHGRSRRMLPQSANHKNPRGPFIKICDAR